jgi:hypothetical protein
MGLIRLQSNSLPSGSVLQVVQSYTANTGNVETTSTSFVASGLSVSITPTSTNNFISIQMCNPMVDHQSALAIWGTMYVNGSPMADADDYHLGYQSTTSRYGSWAFAGKYNPTSLNALTFEPYYRSQDGGNVKFSHNKSSVSLIAMEIAG